LNSGAPGFTFTKVTSGAIVNSHGRSDGSSWADVDNDGRTDAFVVNWYGDNNLFYHNDGGGAFTQITSGPPVNDGGYSETCAWGDYDNDGHIDLYVTNSGQTTGDPNFLYHNNGDGTFTKVTSGPPVEDHFLSRGANWVDYDGDGDMDLFVANEGDQPNNLYRNMLMETGTASFERVTSGEIVTDARASWSGSWGDYDNDGDLDLFVANWNGESNSLFRNNGDGTFTRIATGIEVNDGGYSACAGWGDFDNDGDLDLYVTNAYGTGRKVNFLYKNLLIETGSPDFQKITTGIEVTELGWSYGFAWGDYDNDGDLDLMVAKTWNNNENNSLFRNDNSDGDHWLELRCEGTASNRSAVGATVRVSALIQGTRTHLMRAIEGQSGYCGQNLIAHFGLGDAPVVDTLRIDWPSGASDQFVSVPADRIVHVREGGEVSDAGGVFTNGPSGVATWCAPNPFTERTKIRYRAPVAGEARVSIFSTAGRLVRRLGAGSREGGTGTMIWDGLDEASRPVPTGIYLYRVQGAGLDNGGRVLFIRR
jgi:hypothetical protein